MLGVSAYLDHGSQGDIVDADFLEYYNLDLEETFEKDKWRAYGLIGNLPKHSRTITNNIGGDMLDYSDLMIAKIELLIRTYLWASNDKSNRGPRPEIDIPSYIKSINNKNKEEMDGNDIENAYAWIYDESSVVPVENYN